jgi:general nucleoside transport system ATP-binding protein
MPAAIQLQDITKVYGTRPANEGASLTVEKGAIHAVLGENGAGKSTLLGIAYGGVRADSGRIVLKGEEVPIARHSPAVSIRRGVGMVHQHFMLVPTLTVAENVVLGREPRRGAFLDLGPTAAQIRELSERLGLAVEPDRIVESLSVGEQQRVEIVKILWRGADVLLLDEPTAVLSPPEVAELFAVLRKLALEGKTIVLVTHKLDEVEAIADRITVMRRGQVVEEFDRGAARGAVVRAIVGRDLREAPPSRPRDAREPILEARDVHAENVRGVSFVVHGAEVLGVAGVQGNGQTELIEVLAGLRRARQGSVRLDGVDVTHLPPAGRFARGLAHVAEDRHLRGLVLDFSLEENLLLGRQREFTGRLAVLARKRLREFARERLVTMDVQPPVAAMPARALSGGNQQKVVMARELSRPKLRFLLCAQPTRGVDIGATELIWQAILQARDAGAAVLLISAELSELRALSTRIAVMHRGRLVATLPVDEATDEKLGALMTGAA